MKYYIATRLENHAAHNVVRDGLSKLGHEITYDWTTHGPVWRKGVDEICRVALLERDGVESADVVIGLLPGGRGTHAEIGIAIGRRVPIILHHADDSMFGATPETCAFYHAPDTLCLTGPLSNLPSAVDAVMRRRMRDEERCLFIANDAESRCGLLRRNHERIDQLHPFSGATERLAKLRAGESW